VDVTDPSAIAGGILRLLSHPEMARELGAAAQQRAASIFGPGAVVRGYLDAYAAAARDQAPANGQRHWLGGRTHARRAV
jgi:glycosyltransferase involved in cell wall biosynthesis